MLGVAVDGPGCNSGVYVSLELGRRNRWAGAFYLKDTTSFTSAKNIRPYWAQTLDEVSDDVFVQEDGYRRGARPAYEASRKERGP